MGHIVYLRRDRKPATPPAGRTPAEISRDSLLRLGANCSAIARAERLALLVDGADYFRAFRDAALRARRSITIIGWDFNSRTQLVFDDAAQSSKGTVPPKGMLRNRAILGTPPAMLGEFLNWLARRHPRLHINILDWDYPMVFGTDREFPPIYGFGWKPHRRIQMHYDDHYPVGGCQHQKIVVIDDQVAFTGGIDLTVRRWDTSEHKAGDPRRMAYGKPYPPFHDMMVMVDGDAAKALSRIAAERWRHATGHDLHAVSVNRDAWPSSVEPVLRGVDVGIARTLPPYGECGGVREIERLYLDMIRAARRTIYIENQYFTAPAIAGALATRLAEPEGPEVVLVLRLLSHGWLEENTMHVLRTQLLERLRSADLHGRFRVYYPHVANLDEGTCVDVHAKLMIVDDAWLRIGSANLCNRSMGLDSECDLLLESRGDEKIARVIRDFRNALVAEHVGETSARVDAALKGGGFLHEAIDALATNEGRRLAPLEDDARSETVVSLAAIADPQEPIALDDLFTDRLVETSADEIHNGPAWGRLAAFGGGIAALAAFWHWGPLGDLVKPEHAVAWAHDAASNPWTALLLIALYTPVAFTMFPRPIVTLASVIAYGPWVGAVLAMLGVVTSAIATYYVGRRLRRDTVRRIAGERVHDMVEVLRTRGLVAMTLLRLVPLAPFAVEGLVAGAVRLPMWQLATGTFLGNIPGVLAATVFGNELEAAATARGEFNWWLVGGMLALLVVGALAVRRWFRRVRDQVEKRAHAG